METGHAAFNSAMPCRSFTSEDQQEIHSMCLIASLKRPMDGEFRQKLVQNIIMQLANSR